jgi:hypothetical protein
MVGLNEFLTDSFETLTDNEKLRILSIYGDIFLSEEIVTKDRVLDQILSKIMIGNFDLKNGHSLLMLC